MVARSDGRRRSDAKAEEPKRCINCGQTFTRKRYDRRLEDYSQFNRRKFCSPECGNAARGKPKTLADQLWSGVQKTSADECWLWLRSVDHRGYGRLNDRGTVRSVHRLAWRLINGAIPEGLMVLHHCDVRHCCNPLHLFLGTAQDNTDDMVQKGRHRTSGWGDRPRDKLGRFATN